MRMVWICAGLVLATGLALPEPLFADVIYLKNGSRLEVEAWRDLGDAIEFARGGGVVRIPKAEVQKIEGKPTRRPLRMYSAPASAGGAAAVGAPTDVASRMLDLLERSERVFDQTSRESDEKASALRRLVAEWRTLDVSEPLVDAYKRGEGAIVLAVEAFETEDAVGEAPAQVNEAREELAAAQEAIQEATKEEG